MDNIAAIACSIGARLHDAQNFFYSLLSSHQAPDGVYRGSAVARQADEEEGTTHGPSRLHLSLHLVSEILQSTRGSDEANCHEKCLLYMASNW